jgi:hypothetical protein
VLLIPSWIAVFARQQEPVSPGKQRFTVVALGVGLLLFLGVATIDFTQT